MSSHQPVNRTRARREPPSCHACRAKKLKCDRLWPCANCSIRRLSCEYNRERPAPPSLATAAIKSPDPDLQAQNTALRARVLRLEQAVFGEGASDDVSTTRTLVNESPAATVLEQRGANSANSINGVRVYDTNASQSFSGRLEVDLRTPDQLAFDSTHHFRSSSISLPSRDMAMKCLELFETNLDAIQPVMHIPTTRKMSEAVYADLSAGRELNPGSIALILAICASMGSWELDWHSIFTEATMASHVSALLTRQALRALENARILSEISIEAVQASILLTFRFCQLEHLSSHTRLLHSTAFTMARELGLHRIDAAGLVIGHKTQQQIIDEEVGRKVWWHITSSDWLFAYTGGPHEGTYSIHLHQMAVNKPRNLSHQDLSIRYSLFSRPMDEPTTMAFHLVRIEVATICREVIDEIWKSSIIPDPAQIPYEKVAALDAKFRDLLDGLPRILRVDVPTESHRLESGWVDGWPVCVQRAAINLMIQSRRCKLHLPFLNHFKSDPCYELSRNICLESARKVFQVRQEIESERTSRPMNKFFKLGGQLSHLFYAAFILLMNASVNKDNDSPQQIHDVREAMKVIDEAKRSCGMGSTCYQSLMEILHKHQIDLRFMEPQITESMIKSTMDQLKSRLGAATPETEVVVTNTDCGHDEEMANSDNAFEDIWQDYLYNGSSLDPQNWEALINDLGMHVV